MAKEKKSFFERLTGSVNIDDFDDDAFELDERHIHKSDTKKVVSHEEKDEKESAKEEGWPDEEESEGQLTVDVYQTPDYIVLKAIVAGVKPDDLDVSITRDMVTIRGKRQEEKEVEDDDYYYKELYWGSFSRTILLPQEIQVEESTANEKHGLLIIRLPKIDKARQTKLKVKTS